MNPVNHDNDEAAFRRLASDFQSTLNMMVILTIAWGGLLVQDAIYGKAVPVWLELFLTAGVIASALALSRVLRKAKKETKIDAAPFAKGAFSIRLLLREFATPLIAVGFLAWFGGEKHPGFYLAAAAGFIFLFLGRKRHS